MIAIDKDKPIPLVRGQGRAKYPWRYMEVGDSFFVPGRKPGGIHAPANLKREGHKFTYRQETSDGIPGCRVWRIE